MNRRSFITVALAGVAALAFVAAGVFAPDETGETATHETLDSSSLQQFPDNPETIKNILESDALEDKYVLVEFVAGWCPYCAALEPEMEKAAENLREQGVDALRLTIVIQEGNHLTHERGANAYINTFIEMADERTIPQVQLWKDGQKYGYFAGARSAAAIESFVLETIKTQEAHLDSAPAPLAPDVKPA